MTNDSLSLLVIISNQLFVFKKDRRCLHDLMTDNTSRKRKMAP